MSRHLLILIGNASAEERVEINKLIAEGSEHWFNYTESAWIVCTKNDPAYFGKLLSDRRFTGSNVYHAIFDVGGVELSTGWLPAAAWRWLQSHHMWRG